jgi:hypothetical protein
MSGFFGSPTSAQYEEVGDAPSEDGSDLDMSLNLNHVNRSPHLFQGAALSRQPSMSRSPRRPPNPNPPKSPKRKEAAGDERSTFERVSIGVMYGLINAAVVLPVMMSFGTIIYHDEAFSPYLPTLIKLTLVSSMVHQLCFSLFSSLPYSIGQVQVGAAFRARRAKARRAKARGERSEASGARRAKRGERRRCERSEQEEERRCCCCCSSLA